MTAPRRIFGPVIALTLLALSARAQDLKSEFESGIQALHRGDTQQALRTFEGILAGGPSSEQMFELWKQTDSRDWLDLLTAGPQFELLGEQMSTLAGQGRREYRADDDAIRELVGKATSQDAVERRNAVLKLSADHGEYAVPHLLRGLADTGDDDRRVLSMAALQTMTADVVPALVAALLHHEEGTVRRNVAFVLGNIGDARAAGFLSFVAANDSDTSVREAAASSADRIGDAGDPTLQLLQLGDDYHHRRDSALRPGWSSDAFWTIQGRELVAEPLPAFLYNDAMAARAYGVALQADPGSLAAQAGLARAYVAQEAELSVYAAADALGAVGDEEALTARVTTLGILANAASTDALDLALQWSAESGDAVSGMALADKLGAVAGGPTRGLQMALASNDGALASSAAVAMGEIAGRTGASADSVVPALAETASREIVRIVAIIDADAARGMALASALEGEGVMVNRFDRGASGLATIHRLPGLDAIVVADNLSDVTVDAMLRAIRSDARFTETPVLLATNDAENQAELYGDRIAGTLDAGDMAPVMEAISGDLTGDRERADKLSRRASEVLARLAQAGNTNVGSAVPALLSTIQSQRPDVVIIPAMHALGAAAGPDAAPALLALLGGDGSDEARSAAGMALAGIASRHSGVGGPEAAQMLIDLVRSTDASAVVRGAAANALGRMNLDPQQRLSLLLGGTSSASN